MYFVHAILQQQRRKTIIPFSSNNATNRNKFRRLGHAEQCCGCYGNEESDDGVKEDVVIDDMLPERMERQCTI